MGGRFRAELGVSDEPFVGIIGRIVPLKGQEDLVLAAPEILRIFPRVKFVLVGEADEDNGRRLEELMDRTGVRTSFFLTGHRDEIDPILAGLDILVNASLSEGFSRAVIEAMALAKPVVATRVSGNSEAVVHGETGFLVDPKDPDQLAGSILRLLRDPDLARRFGEKGRARVFEKFSLRGQIKKIEEIYRECLCA
jgi:glycosyltransferase involved in cell wall biosynthesis